MATNLMNVFKNVDLQGVGKTAANIVSLAFKPNKKQGLKLHELFPKQFIDFPKSPQQFKEMK